ncbi:hypothetical protein NHQ30_009812 [Ciborinia camelliae]|nr:hypothetical protein NHQ30_009812 [Ciborinia camelliae]
MPKRRLSSPSSVDTLALEGEPSPTRIRTASPQRTRVIVNINFDSQPSTRFIIPISPLTTIAQLQDQVFNRARRLEVKIPDDSIVFRLEAQDGPITFPEDTIEDIFGTVEPKIIWVTLAHLNSSCNHELVYIRWITPGRALDHYYLNGIQTDKQPLTRGMTVNEVIAVAKDRIFGAAGDEITPAPGFNIGLWFNKAGDDKPIWALGTQTIGELGLSGSLEDPLNTFLVLIRADRGMATFETCLKVLISAAAFRPYLIPFLLERTMVVINITEAKNILETFLRTNMVPERKALTILANCFREITLRMIPSAFIGHKIESVLEGSRQIFAWMFGDILEEIAKPVRGISKRMSLPATSEFREILNSCNSSEYFRMLSPLELDGRENSGISLSKAGYVSHYTANGDETSLPRLDNPITGIETLQLRPGQGLLEHLQPIISQRRIDGTWEIDDWELKVEPSSLDTTLDSGPDEAIVICFDDSLSMKAPLDQNWIGNGQLNSLRRFDEAKQVFRNVIARLTAYRLNVHVGLVTFGAAANIRKLAEIAPIGKEFKNELENTQATSNITALFDACATAHSMLTAYKDLYLNSAMKLRIIALTDGEDNSSKRSAENVCSMLYQDNIVLDSIVIGDDSPVDLFKMSKHTGGYAFQPTSRLLLFQTFLLEPFLDILARPDIVRIPITDYETSLPKKADMRSIHDFPPCRPHQLQDGGFVSLDAARRRLAGNSSSLLEIARTSASAEPANRSSGRLFLDEMRLMIANPHASMDVYVSEVDMAFWKIIMSGPESTPYSQGTFALFVHMTETYPQKAPTVRFITPVLHPNISKHGRICHEIFEDGWKTSLHIHDILKTVFTLFENPKASCDAAIDELATLKFWTDRTTADVEIRKYVSPTTPSELAHRSRCSSNLQQVTRFATRSRLEWKAEMDSSV